jgi:hypothetical protein
MLQTVETVPPAELLNYVIAPSPALQLTFSQISHHFCHCYAVGQRKLLLMFKLLNLIHSSATQVTSLSFRNWPEVGRHQVSVATFIVLIFIYFFKYVLFMIINIGTPLSE